MDRFAAYLGYAYAILGALGLVLEGAKRIAAINGADGPEDAALSKAGQYLALVSNFVSQIGPDLRTPKAKAAALPPAP